MRLLFRILGTLMIVAGVVMLAWAVTVWQWQDPVTAVLHNRDQRSLERTFERKLQRHDRPQIVVAAASPAEVRRELSRDAVKWRKQSKQGDAIARLRIPRLGVTEIVVNGTDANSLKRGPGRYLGTAMPGEGQLVYVAGHRTTYGAPFSHITSLRPGDRVYVELPYGTFEYAITGHRIVPADQLSVLKSKGFEQLALQACHPRFFASQRYIAYAKPVGVTLPGASTQTPLEALG
ncbi:MAG TPA: sortase [Gaiellaceae bacterium]|jgi:sortase A